MGRRQFALNIGAGEQGGGEPRVQAQEGDGFDQPSYLRQPRAKTLEDETGEIGRFAQQPLEQGRRDENEAQIGLGDALGAVLQPAHQAERGLDAGLSRRHPVEQQAAAVFRRDADTDPTFEQQEKALAGRARREKLLSPPDAPFGQARQGFPRLAVELGERRKIFKPGRRLLFVQLPASSSLRKRARIASRNS